MFAENPLRAVEPAYLYHRGRDRIGQILLGFTLPVLFGTAIGGTALFANTRYAL